MRRVLLVPDHVIVGELGPSYFDRLSVSVRAARDAGEALAMAAAFRPDLIVCRDDLHDTTPRAFAAAARKALPQVRLLLVTELLGGAQGDASEYYDACLVQPVDAEQLLATAARLLEVRTRRSGRVSLESIVQMEGFGLTTPDRKCIANAIDVSQHGMLLESSEHLALGQSGTLTFFLPTDEGRVRVAGTARVAMDEVRLHYAVEFANVDDVTRSLLAQYVAGQRKA